MFDFIRKKLNKTIKDASESIPEEELEEQNTENSQETSENNEENKKSRFGFFNKHKNDEKEEESDSENDDVSDSVTSNEEETKETDDETNIETSEIITEENTEETDNTPDETKEIEETDDTEIKEIEDSNKEVEKEKKHRFGFLHRNKNKKESKKENTEDKLSIEETSNKDIEETNAVETTNKEVVKTEDKEKKSFFDKNKEENKKEDSDLKYEDEKKGGRFGFITTKTVKEDDISDILETLEFSLIEGDVAFDVAETIVENVKEDLVGRKIKRRGDMELFTTNALKKTIFEIIDNGYYDLLGDIEASKQKGEPYKIMFVGINGTGKTTTIAKIATYLRNHGYTSVFGASDTFRAGAIEQLEYHADNLNLKIIKHSRNSDPAAVAYDAVDHAKATGKDVVLIDTSGRMQTNANLMDEMKKIKRIAKPDIVIYVGDSLMGNDATEQAYKFNEVIDIDGIILTKTDADAKGGAALSIGHVIHKPILFIGTGQGYDDLMEFKPEWMIDHIFDDSEDE